ncbi:MAG TPA: DUF5719 family protein [Mycobacteriales bacterium]|nr:DUF5719 family protein [Mycobacteriales bacterium]
MMRALRWPAVAIVLLAGLTAAAIVDRPSASPTRALRSSSLPVTSTSLVCPNISGSGRAPTAMTVANVSAAVAGGHRSATVRTFPLTSARAKTTTLPSHAVNHVHVTTTSGPTVVEADGRGAGAVVADQSRLIPHGVLRGMFSSPCLQPTTDSWITGADGRVGFTDTLVLANADSTVANITVTVWSAKGPIEPPQLESYTVAADTAELLPVSRYVPDGALLTIHVHANSGRLVSAVLDRRVSGVEPTGLDWIPPTQPPSTELVVPGFLSGSGARHLVLADPGDRDATVTLRLVTASGNFAPAGHQTVVVRAGHSADVDLASSLAGAPGAVLVHSDQPVTATAFSSAAALNDQDHPDLQFQPAAAAITGPAVLPDNTPPFDRNVRLYVTAPDAAAKLRVATTTGASRVLTIRAGRSLAWDPVAVFGTDAYGPLVFTPVGGGSVYVSRTLFAYGAHGPLTTAEQPTLLPASISLPPAVLDERVAVPDAR